MNRVRGLDALLIPGITRFRRKLGLLAAVKIGKSTRHHITLLELLRVSKWLKEPTTHNLKPLFSTGRAP